MVGMTTEEVVLLLLLLNRFSTCCSRKVDESAFETILGVERKREEIPEWNATTLSQPKKKNFCERLNQQRTYK